MEPPCRQRYSTQLGSCIWLGSECGQCCKQILVCEILCFSTKPQTLCQHKLSLSNFLVESWVGNFWICKLPLTLQIQLLWKNFVKAPNVLSAKSCADAFESKFIVSDSIVKWLWSIFSDNIYRGLSHPVRPLSGMLDGSWKKFQQF